MIQFCSDGQLLKSLPYFPNQLSAESDEDFPSWVPRFDYPELLGGDSSLHPENSGQSQPLLVKSIDTKVLILKGAIISIISSTDSCADGYLEGGDSHLRNLWERTMVRLRPHYTPEGLENAFIQTVTAANRMRSSTEKVRHYLKEIIRGGPHEEHQYDTELLKFIDSVFQHHSGVSLGEDKVAAEAVASLARGDLKPESGEDPLMEVKNGLILRNFRVRDYSFLITDNGRMGLAAKVAEPGDEVCVFHGYPLPFLIRKAGEHHRLLGQCYIHGLIEGEAFQDLKAGRLEEHWISLR
jgi:hypothetical protein